MGMRSAAALLLVSTSLDADHERPLRSARARSTSIIRRKLRPRRAATTRAHRPTDLQ